LQGYAWPIKPPSGNAEVRVAGFIALV